MPENRADGGNGHARLIGSIRGFLEEKGVENLNPETKRLMQEIRNRTQKN